jgi:hypothetical protein
MIVTFDYYLHDDSDTESRCETIMQTASQPVQIDDELAEKIGRPFYEVVLSCTLDTDTGKVVITGVKQ